VSDARAPGRAAQRIAVPVLSMESFQDEAVTSRGDYYQERIEPQRLWLLQTNGGHDLYASRAFVSALLDFFDRFVKGVPNGFERRPRTTVWMETATAGTDYNGRQERAAPRWTLSLPSLRQVAVRPVEFALGKDAQLGVAAATGAPDEFEYPVPGPAVVIGDVEESWGALPARWRSGSLHYTTAPLRSDLLAWGSGSADLWLSSTAADADVQATLTELRPDGQEMFVQRGWLRLSNRVLDASATTPLRPVPVDRPESLSPLESGEPVLARIELNKFAHAFRAGSRIRLWIDTPSPWGGYRFSPYVLPAKLSLWHDAEHASLLRLGVLDGIAVPADRSTCGAVLGQPCRPDPLAATSAVLPR